jgi:Putative esterase
MDGLTLALRLDQAEFQAWLLQHPRQVVNQLPVRGLPGGPQAKPAQVRSAIDNNIASLYRDYIDDESSGLNPGNNEMAEIGLWLELEVGIGFLVGLGLGSLTGQRTTTTIVLIALDIIVTPLLEGTPTVALATVRKDSTMPMPWSADLAGRIDEHVISSDLLRGNPLGDSCDRPLLVYTPPGYDNEPDQRYPAGYVIQGYTGHVVMWRERRPFRQPFPEAADAMFARGEAPPAIVVYVDAWTAYGGSQFVDSPGTGKYHSYLCEEVVPWVDARYRTIPDAAHRAIMGKSSGGSAR